MTSTNRVDKLSPHATRYRHGETGTRLYNIWATMKEQQNNRCKNHLISFNGETKTLSQWADAIGIAQKTLRRRIVDKEWPIEKALTTPLQTQYRRRFTNGKVDDKK